MTSSLPPILDVDALRGLLAGPDPVHLLDVRWALDGSKGEHTYRDGHLPGAVYIDLPTALAAPATPSGGRHPLPSPEDFAATLRAAGVREGETVIAYDDDNGSQASRLVWMLRAAGHPAALLDGGLAAWDGELSTETPEPAPGDVTARDWPAAALADIEEVAAGDAVVVDARAPERYRGEVESVDPRAGHVPGAINLPFTGNLTAGNRFESPEALRERFAAAGIDADTEVIVYCGSGVTATHDVLALQRAGIEQVRLFPGSWSQWSADASRPVATGEAP